jgi:hypothetical protein
MVMLVVLRRGIAVAVDVVAPRRTSDAEGYGIDEEGGCSALPGAFADRGTRRRNFVRWVESIAEVAVVMTTERPEVGSPATLFGSARERR